MSNGGDTNFTVIFNAKRRVLRMPDSLRAILELDPDSEVDWQSLVIEDASSFVPGSSDSTLRKTGYLKRKSGEILPASFNCEMIEESDGLVCAEISVPTTSEKRMEPVERESLDFLTTVSHELRVALNGVIGFANVLNDSTLNVNQRAILEKLQSCNHMLKGLINDILEYSRVATSKINLKAESVDLSEFVHEVVGLFRERARSKGLQVEVEVGDELHSTVVLPRMRVTQVLSNLIANAIKFTDQGWVRVSASLREDSLCIDIQDTGPGVDPSLSDSIFKPFFRLGDQADSPEGTGLGLAISKELTAKMGGELVLKQPSGGGSLFSFSLPLKKWSEDLSANEVMPNEPVRSVERAKCRNGDKRVLVVEDNQLNADILGHFLQDYGVAFDHVDNGRAAVEVYQDGKYDLILMDVMLPEMNGYEATEKILAHSKLKPPVPIVGVTAKVFRQDQMRCIEVGMVEVVHKPVDFRQLRKVLDQRMYSSDPVEDKVTAPSGSGAVVEKVSESSGSEALLERAPSSGGRDCMDAGTLEAYIDRMKTPDTSRSDIVKTATAIVDAEVISLVESIDKGDRKEVGMRAHSLKGALALLGARDIMDLAKGLELIANDGRSPLKAEHWKNMVEGSYANFRKQLEAYMETTVVD
ncbi:ATP-binding protein [Pelagicoccus sp. SDUM812002]|uniref:sensor histidine kinase n=1 Tax=Pelagicoccus sp. SDUM812002 TaxID=3041266 RepID=UPI00280CDC88|nr:ATP-binding protein [Pelagicoccus sp. SDUM812002]MDQ8186943.1 response regulator [Pelagicoccus sp. SDUM812002]